MGAFAKLKSIWENNRKTVIIIASSVLAVLFIGSILLAVFVGGEFKKEEVITYDVKGAISIVKPGVYETEYEVGDAFVFDKTKNKINLIYQYTDDADHSDEYGQDEDGNENSYAVINDLDGGEYGFCVNGAGQVYDEADEIQIDGDVKYISVVWVRYPHIKVNIDIKIKDGTDS